MIERKASTLGSVNRYVSLVLAVDHGQGSWGIETLTEKACNLSRRYLDFQNPSSQIISLTRQSSQEVE